jgi:hypothetical protein
MVMAAAAVVVVISEFTEETGVHICAMNKYT